MDAVEHQIDELEWESINNKLAKLAQLTSRSLQRV